MTARILTNKPIENFIPDPSQPLRNGLAFLLQNSPRDKNGNLIGVAEVDPLSMNCDEVKRDDDGNVCYISLEEHQKRAERAYKLVQPFINHLKNIMNQDERDVDIFLDYMAYKLQYFSVKPRWAIVLAGGQGVGKDISIEACWQEYGLNAINNISPADCLSNYNDYLDCMLLRISEVADLQDLNKWQFNEKMKVVIAGHPDRVRVNKKYGMQYWMRLRNGTILTTNHLENGLFMPKDDRRYYVIKCANSADLGFDNFQYKTDYFEKLFNWFTTKDGVGTKNPAGYTGYRRIGIYLMWYRNVENFNVNICPRPSAAKLEVIKQSNSIPDWLDDIMDKYCDILNNDMKDSYKDEWNRELWDAITTTIDGKPMLVCVSVIKMLSSNPIENRNIDFNLKKAEYERLNSPSASDSKWRMTINGKQRKLTIYCLEKRQEQVAKIQELLKNNSKQVAKIFELIGGLAGGTF